MSERGRARAHPVGRASERHPDEGTPGRTDAVGSGLSRTGDWRYRGLSRSVREEASLGHAGAVRRRVRGDSLDRLSEGGFP